MKITPIITFVICLCLLACRPACAQATNTTSAVTNFVNIGGRQLELATFGQGTPSVIVEAGLSDPAVESGSWKSVIDEVAKTTRICIYDRAGLGKSDAVTNASRTSLDFMKDLHALLVNAKVPPPYILVGHSIGGFTVRVYASKYPGEVAGVVLVDSSYPNQLSKFLTIMPPESPHEQESIKKLRNFFRSQMVDPHDFLERLDIVASSAEVSAAGDFGNKPLIVISHSHDWSSFPDLPKGLSDKMEQLWGELQNGLCRLSSNSTHETAVKAGHYIQTEDPQLVSEAILKVVEATKK
jgi:pimeloyl-ACP methyl ester carboxylesterase